MQPYGFSFLTLGELGSEPDTLYVADRRTAKRGSLIKYWLSGGKWIEHGSVQIPQVSGVTANDMNGLVTIYATTAA